MNVAARASAVLAPDLAPADALETERDSRDLLRLVLKEEGWRTWSWRGMRVNYVSAGPDPGSGPGSLPPLLLIHGFGASVYHWRYNIPELAQHGRVYALDLLGFGWSEKALVDYSPALWRQQVADFVDQVIGEPAVLVGNSVGGYTCLSTAAFHPDQVQAVVLVNSAGRFRGPKKEAQQVEADESEGKASSVWSWAVERLQSLLKRAGLYVAFQQARQPARIQQVLKTVYADQGSVDEDLVRSIIIPAQDANAAEVYYRLVTQVLLHPSSLPVDDLLDRIKTRSAAGGSNSEQPSSDKSDGDSLGDAGLSGGNGAGTAQVQGSAEALPMLLLWGVKDPWCTPDKADVIMALYSKASRVDVLAGHCPHDESPKDVNSALLTWWRGLPA